MTKRPFTEPQMDILARLISKLRREILDGDNRVRTAFGLPIEKSLPMPPKPRYRVQAGSAPWP